MIFVKGFVHADPHPGNLLVQRGPRGRTRLVLLDHGLYRDLPADFRLEYAQLWQSLILWEPEAIKMHAQRLGVDEYRMFASMLTARAWEKYVSPPLHFCCGS